MISEIARDIPEQLAGVSGKVFYAGRDAFQAGRSMYLLGYNPGGNPDEHVAETVESHTKAVLTSLPSNWSAYRDESWLGRWQACFSAQSAVAARAVPVQLDAAPGLRGVEQPEPRPPVGRPE